MTIVLVLSCLAPVLSAAKAYSLEAPDGGLFTYGDASFYGSAGGLSLNQPIVGMAATPDGQGYWFVAADGGVFTYGDAAFHGSAGGMPAQQARRRHGRHPDRPGLLARRRRRGDLQLRGRRVLRVDRRHDAQHSPSSAWPPRPTGKGYWLVGADGGIFTYGDAAFYGSAGGMTLNAPVVGMAATGDDGGYWLVASDGGIFTYGDARVPRLHREHDPLKPIVGMATTSDGGATGCSVATVASSPTATPPTTAPPAAWP